MMWLKDYIHEQKGAQKNGDGHKVIPNNPKRDMSPWPGASLSYPRGVLVPWAGSDTVPMGQWKTSL